jgi:hypothetical protein
LVKNCVKFVAYKHTNQNTLAATGEAFQMVAMNLEVLPAPDANLPDVSEDSTDPRAEHGRAAEAKWGKSLDGGFQIVPDLLLRHQGSLNLTTNDVVVLLHLTMAWWEAERPPFPRAHTIARRMGASERTVQRSLSRLQNLKLFNKTKVKGREHEWRQGFDLTPLTAKLTEIAETDFFAERRRLLRTEAAGVQTQSLAQAQ